MEELPMDEDVASLLRIAAYQQEFDSPDDELTRVVSGYIDARDDESRRESQPVPAVQDALGGRARGAMPENAPHQLAFGTVLGGSYMVGEVLGQGGFGITYLGWDMALDMRVAVKEYYPAGHVARKADGSNGVYVTDERDEAFVKEGRERFLSEARTLAKFQDMPGVVGVKAFFEENATAYIVMEFLEGQDLRKHLGCSMPFAADDIFRRMAPIMEALEQMHRRHILHRDISPDNIMLCSDGSLKLMDFGAARALDPCTSKSVSVMLKPGYAPAEQYLPKGEQGPWTDVYALCATLYTCITGSVPDDALQRAHQDELAWPSQLGFPIEAHQELALMRGMAPDPDGRFRSVSELRAALDATAPAPANVRRRKPVHPGVRGRARALVALAAVLVVAVFGIVLGVTLSAPRLSATNVTMVKGSTERIVLERAGEDVEWRVDDKSVLSLDPSGAELAFRAEKKGEALLMAVSAGKLYECRVEVESPKLSDKALSVVKGTSSVLTLKGTTLPVSWESDDASVAVLSVVDGGRATVTGKALGSCHVVAVVGGMRFSCAVDVVEPAPASPAGGVGARRKHAAAEDAAPAGESGDEVAPEEDGDDADGGQDAETESDAPVDVGEGEP